MDLRQSATIMVPSMAAQYRELADGLMDGVLTVAEAEARIPVGRAGR